MAYEYFISYRRKNGGINQAQEIHKILVASVGADKVFWDLESLDKECLYPKEIKEAIEQAQHFILLINEAFFDKKDDPNDWYFKEIRQAMELKKDITPIFYDGVRIFDNYDLPEDFRELANWQKLVYCKENATHFDLYLTEHLGIEKKQTSFSGYDDLLKKLFNLSVNVGANQYNFGYVNGDVSKDDHSSTNVIGGMDNTTTYTMTNVNYNNCVFNGNSQPNGTTSPMANDQVLGVQKNTGGNVVTTVNNLNGNSKPNGATSPIANDEVSGEPKNNVSNVAKSFNFDANMWKNFVLKTDKDGSKLFFIPDISKGLDNGYKEQFKDMINELLSNKVIVKRSDEEVIDFLAGDKCKLKLNKGMLLVQMEKYGVDIELPYYPLSVNAKAEYQDWDEDGDANYFDLSDTYDKAFQKILGNNGVIQVL